MAMSSSYSAALFPSLHSATFEPLSGDGEVEVNYKSGAYFKGQVQDYKRIGQGIFSWPNGARYEGDYADNVRSGTGTQLWPDGSQYEGQFDNDLRHGDGQHTWTNQESYSGHFFQDRRHGWGMYKWPDGSTFSGTFYMDRKEGYGILKFANGNSFEGLYREDEREGPGVMTYADGSQDVGLWHGEKLVKICSAIPGAFTMKNHPEFDFNPDEHLLHINDDEPAESTTWLSNRLSPFQEIESFDNDLDSVPEKVTQIFNVSLDPRSLGINKDLFDKEFFQTDGTDKQDSEKIVAWNKTPSMIHMQKHVHKHKGNEQVVSFDVNKIFNGERSKFKNKGQLETASEELLTAATQGNVKVVEDLLTSGKVLADVADKNGHTALIGATVNWHTDVINCLLNHGADVNKLTDEGCSALSAGSIFFYPVDSFRYNIAERYLDKPPDVQQKKKRYCEYTSSQQQTQNQPKGILTNKQTGSKKNIANMDNKNAENGQTSDRSEKYDSNVSLASIYQENKNQNLKTSPRMQLGKIEGQKQVTLRVEGSDQEELMAEQEKEEFDSAFSLKYYPIEVSDHLIERCATQLSMNEKVVAGQRSDSSMGLGTVRHLAVIKNERERMKQTLDLLLRRGADPNASGVPMPVLFFAIKAADVEMVTALLLKGASTSITLPKEKGSLAPLHISCAIPGEEGVQITELLLDAMADPDVRAAEDDSFLDKTLMDEWSKDAISEESQVLLGGRTPLLIACARDDSYRNSTRVIRLLLDHKANTNLLCNGFSALALCVASGNDAGIDELLVYGNDTSLPLTHGVGSALCAATNTEYEYRRPINGRILLIDKLISAGANILAPIPIGPKRLIGTAVDYAHYMFQQDHRIARTPYHALTTSERETFNDRRRLLAHIGHILRGKAVEREKRRLYEEQKMGSRSASPSSAFVYIGAGAPLPPDAKVPKFLKTQPLSAGDGPVVTFEGSQHGVTPVESVATDYKGDGEHRVGPRKPLFKYCYECGRSVNVTLTACTRCKEVYYCGKPCKLKAWNARHKEECIRIGARSRSPSPGRRKQRDDSPTPATNPDKGKKTTVANLTKDKKGLRIHSGSHSDISSHGGFGRSPKGSSTPISERLGSSRPLSMHSSLRECSLTSFEVPRKGLSLSAKMAERYGAKDPRRNKSGRLSEQHPNMDNYSFV